MSQVKNKLFLAVSDVAWVARQKMLKAVVYDSLYFIEQYLETLKMWSYRPTLSFRSTVSTMSERGRYREIRDNVYSEFHRQTTVRTENRKAEENRLWQEQHGQR
mgnify:CR=1 FL=1